MQILTEKTNDRRSSLADFFIRHHETASSQLPRYSHSTQRTNRLSTIAFTRLIDKPHYRCSVRLRSWVARSWAKDLCETTLGFVRICNCFVTLVRRHNFSVWAIRWVSLSFELAAEVARAVDVMLFPKQIQLSKMALVLNLYLDAYCRGWKLMLAWGAIWLDFFPTVSGSGPGQSGFSWIHVYVDDCLSEHRNRITR